MATPSIDPAKVAAILVDASLIGDEAAAKRHGVSERTVWRHRQRMREDPQLAEAVAKKAEAADPDWAERRRTFLAVAMAKLQELVAQAGVEQIRDVAGAIKIVGDLEVVVGALANGQQPGPAGAGQQAPGAPTGASSRLSH